MDGAFRRSSRTVHPISKIPLQHCRLRVETRATLYGLPPHPLTALSNSRIKKHNPNPSFCRMNYPFPCLVSRLLGPFRTSVTIGMAVTLFIQPFYRWDNQYQPLYRWNTQCQPLYRWSTQYQRLCFTSIPRLCGWFSIGLRFPRNG